MKGGCWRMIRGFATFVMGIVVLAIVAVALTFLLSNAMLRTEEVTVPNVVNKNIDEAIALLSVSNLGVEPFIERFNESIESGRVIRQLPEPGRKAKAGRRVRLYISRGSQMVETPDCTGMPVSDALLALRLAGLESHFQSESYHAEIPAGRVITTSPAPGSMTTRNRPFDLLISLGPPQVAYVMPDLKGMDLEVAVEGLMGMGLETDVQRFRPDDPQQIGRIADQTPPPGSRVEFGEMVGLRVAGTRLEAERSMLRLVTVTLPEEALAKPVRIDVLDANGYRTVYTRDRAASLQLAEWVWLAGGGEVLVIVGDDTVAHLSFTGDPGRRGDVEP